MPITDAAASRYRGVVTTTLGGNGPRIFLALTADRGGILAGPKACLTGEARRWIRDNRDDLMRRLLFARALSYYERYLLDAGGSASSPAARKGYAELSTNAEDLNAAFSEADPDTFEEVLQRWLKRGLVAYQRALVAEQAGPESPAPEQYTLTQARR